MSRQTIHLKRVYEPAVSADGQRFLVDRIWPRGLSKADLATTIWLKEIAPTPSLRKGFGHDPRRWSDFRKRYLAELDAMDPSTFQPLREALSQGPVTLVYAAKDTMHNHAIVLRDHLLSRPDASR